MVVRILLSGAERAHCEQQGVELSERTASSKVRSETVDSLFSAVAKKKVVTCDKGTENFDSGNTGTTSKPPSSKPPQFRCALDQVY